LKDAFDPLIKDAKRRALEEGKTLTDLLVAGDP